MRNRIIFEEFRDESTGAHWHQSYVLFEGKMITLHPLHEDAGREGVLTLLEMRELTLNDAWEKAGILVNFGERA